MWDTKTYRSSSKMQFASSLSRPDPLADDILELVAVDLRAHAVISPETQRPLLCQVHVSHVGAQVASIVPCRLDLGSFSPSDTFTSSARQCCISVLHINGTSIRSEAGEARTPT